MLASGIEGVDTLFSSCYPVISRKDRWSGIKLQLGGEYNNNTTSHVRIMHCYYNIELDVSPALFLEFRIILWVEECLKLSTILKRLSNLAEHA